MWRKLGSGRPRALGSQLGLDVAFLAFGLLLSSLVYWPTLDYQFVYDDYGFIRPHTTAEVLASFMGPWDPNGPNVAFFRPLTVLFHAWRFELFQFDPTLYHAFSIALFGIATGLIGSAVALGTGSYGAGLLA